MSGSSQRIPKPLLDRTKYTIGIVCALENEAVAVQSSFDHHFLGRHERPSAVEGDRNSYSYGTIGDYYIVLAQLPKKGMGKLKAGDVSADMRRSFPSIKLCLLVGICAIVPKIPEDDEKKEALMGDIVISSVVKQYDYGKEYPVGFHAVELFEKAPEQQERAEALFRTPVQREYFRERLLRKYLMDLDQHRHMKTFGYPGFAYDHLYSPDHEHKHLSDCDLCAKGEYCEKAVNTDCTGLGCSRDPSADKRERIASLREALGSLEADSPESPKVHRLKSLSEEGLVELLPRIFLGDIASGDKVMKNGTMRDEVAEDRKVIAFEMEGAGVWQNFPTVVIKSGCDYGDSHKNKLWQKYACMTAAACAKAFLENLQMGIPSNVKYTDENDSEAQAGAGQGGNIGTRGGAGMGGVVNNWSGGTFSGRNINAGNVYHAKGDQHFG